MKKSFLIVGLTLVAGCCGLFCDNYSDTVEEGFVPLFNGKDLTGWSGSAMYGVETIEVPLKNGTTNRVNVLACYPERKTPGDFGNLLTDKEYRNFILRFEFVLPENGDSGLGLRVPSSDVDAAYHGMCEIQLLDDGGSAYYDSVAQTNYYAAYRYAGSVFGIFAPRHDNVGKQIWGKDKNFSGGGSYMRRAGMWNFAEVKVFGSEIEFWLNGYCLTKGDVAQFKGDGDTPDGRAHPGLHNAKGRIGWLSDKYHVMWKNIRIKELPDDARMPSGVPDFSVTTRPNGDAGFMPYFTGTFAQLMAMWKGVTTEEDFDNPLIRQKATPAKRMEMQKIADEGRDAHWSVLPDGVLHFDGFKGGYSLATYRNFGDFELWADWRTLSITGDSGLYLRGSPQVQIWDAHNQWGIGSGGLYNNQKNLSQALKIADRPVGDWNRFHVIMRGAKVTVWLNGVLVVDNVVLENYWDRTRPIFPVEQIELQCHGDPVEWNNIFIKELE